jgi:hypothetical protein
MASSEPADLVAELCSRLGGEEETEAGPDHDARTEDSECGEQVVERGAARLQPEWAKDVVGVNVSEVHRLVFGASGMPRRAWPALVINGVHEQLPLGVGADDVPPARRIPQRPPSRAERAQMKA